MKFSDVIGHESAKDYLRGLVEEGNVPHSLMISGPSGIGKMPLALAFAQYLHCTSRHDGDSCGVCPACRQHQSFNFPDMLFCYPVHGSKNNRHFVSDDFAPQWKEFLSANPLAPYPQWLEAINAENSQPIIKVSESDEIIRKISLSNYSAETKVMLIWLPEKLQPAAANKLLKIIEEPPEGNVFVFVSDSPAEILPTIFSRTQRLDLKPLPADSIAGWLIKRHGVSSQEALRIASASSGSLLKAEEIVSADNENAEFRELFQTLMRRAFMKDIDALKDWSEQAASLKREKSRRFIAFASRQIRGNFLAGMGLSELDELDTPDKEFSKKFSAFIHEGNVEEISTNLTEAARDISANGNPRIVFFDLALQMIVLIKSPKHNLT